MKQKSNERNSIGDCVEGETIIQYLGDGPNIFQVIEIIPCVSYTVKRISNQNNRKGEIETYEWDFWQDIPCKLLTDDEKVKLL